MCRVFIDFFSFLCFLLSSSLVLVTDTIKALSIEQCAAQVFLFFIAGNETTSATISYTLYELGLNNEAMAKCQTEIDTILNNNNGVLSYEAVHEMKYLDACVSGEAVVHILLTFLFYIYLID